MWAKKVREESDRAIININNDVYVVIKSWGIIEKMVDVMKIAKQYVPVPNILEHGKAGNGSGYMIMEAVQGVQDESKISKDGYGGILESLRKTSTLAHGTVRKYMGINMNRVCGVIESHATTVALKSVFDMVNWDQYNMCLTHGDLHPGNIIVDEKGEPIAILDWEYASYGPEFMDEVTAWIYHPHMIMKINKYPTTVVFVAFIIHIFVFRPDLSKQCLNLMNSQPALLKDATTKHPNGTDTALSTLLALLANNCGGHLPPPPPT